jgi:Peptidase family S49 N-terminal
LCCCCCFFFFLSSPHIIIITLYKTQIKEASKKQTKIKDDEEKQIKDEFEKNIKYDLEHGGLTLRDVRQKYRRPTAFYVEFDGDVMVSSMELLRKQISIIVNLASPAVGDICVINLTSSGGAVSQYGLAASQLV